MLLTAAAAIAFSIWFVDMAQLHRVLRINFKPFSCVLCLVVWVYMVFSFCPAYVSLNAFYACSASIIAAIISKLLDKWK